MLAFLAAIALTPVLATDPVAHDADDAAVWVHPSRPERSLILGTNKQDGKGGALVVFGLNGRTQRTIAGIDRPNNVDVEYGFKLNNRNVDLAVVTERGKRRLRIFAISANGTLADVSGNTNVFVGEAGPQSEPMGISMYRDAKTGQIDAIVSRKFGPQTGYLGRFRLVANQGRVDVADVGRLGAFSGEGEIESIIVDDAAKTVYYSDENAGLRSVRMDGSSPRLFGKAIFKGDREGLAMLDGHLMATDQLERNSRLLAFNQHSTDEPVAIFTTGADSTDGIEICPRPLGNRFPNGILVAMNSKDKNFLIYDLARIRRALR